VNRNAKSCCIRPCVLGVYLQFGAICAGQTPNSAPPAETIVTVTKIAGTVVSSETGAPLAQTRVSIADTKNRANMRWMITNESGRFEFDRISPGKYSLVGAKRGFLTGAYEQHEQFSTAIVTGTEFATTQLVLRLTPMASIEGRVVDEAGDPVRQGRVTLYRENQEMGFGRQTIWARSNSHRWLPGSTTWRFPHGPGTRCTLSQIQEMAAAVRHRLSIDLWMSLIPQPTAAALRSPMAHWLLS
jgi:hypothetical protein